MHIKTCFIAMGLLTSIITAVKGEPLEVGAVAPKVTSVTEAGEQIDLGKVFAENEWVFVYFYPKAHTGGCTAQACSLRDAYEALTEKDLVVFGVSMDSVEQQASFKAKHNLPYTLLADTEGAVVKAFGVPARGRFPARQAFLIKDNRVVWRDLSASTGKQAQDALAAIESVSGPSS